MALTEITNVTMFNITEIINITGDPIEFIINSNHIIYGGWFYFVMLFLLGLLLFRKAQEKQDQPLVNAMYVCSALTVLSFFLRAISVVRNGVVIGLLTDYMMWMFPLAAVALAAIVKFNSDS
jgi:vacuolar-type H+-ATPase subunit I/STV1